MIASLDPPTESEDLLFPPFVSYPVKMHLSPDALSLYSFTGQIEVFNRQSYSFS